MKEIEGVSFRFVCEIVPEMEGASPKEYMPQSRYVNTRNLPLHEYGRGPFCKFSIPPSAYGLTGVYAIALDGEVKYVGECEDLGKRFNAGYGNISPRNCFRGGQPTNCRINNYVLEETQQGSNVDLYFNETTDRFRLERVLISKLNPAWNRSSGKTGSARKSD